MYLRLILHLLLRRDPVYQLGNSEAVGVIDGMESGGGKEAVGG